MVRREPIANDAYEHLADQLTDRGGEIETVKAALKAQRIETPSWGYGDSGTRFKVFAWPGVARDVYEKLADAAFIHRLTGIAPSVALHIPWDQVNDWAALRQYAAERGVRIGAINPNLFQDEAYKFGSVCNADPAVRRQWGSIQTPSRPTTPATIRRAWPRSGGGAKEAPAATRRRETTDVRRET